EADYEAQKKNQQLVCPLCADAHIERRPSAPRLNLGAAPFSPEHQAPDQRPQDDNAALAAVAPAQKAFQKAVLGMVRQLLGDTQDVGERFAQEARRMHEGKTPERGIRGVVSQDEAQALIDDGVPIVPLPWANALKETLH
ncbi:MAG TPA: DUF1178 family protein, partial [Burkholderiaceae bacterium]|nr:DUF1178 family protein [Burkholderiaceae bacterium]